MSVRSAGPDRPPIEAACYWLATRPPRQPRPLAGDRRADVVIVGAGFTGLWTAVCLKRIAPALDVCILEQEVAGYGGSGRNAGIVGETLDHSHELAAAHFGRDEARELARLGRANLDELEAFLAGEGIDAEFRRTGQLIVALRPEQVDALRGAVAFANGLGLSDWRLLSADETRAEVASPRYLGAALAPKSGTIHPIKLLDGLLGAASRLGIEVFERTPVRELAVSNGRVVARPERGSVTAEKAVLAANAYTHRLRPELLPRFLPLYDYVLVSVQLPPGEREAIGWRARRGVTDARAFFNYYRLTADDRILFGTSEAVYYPGNRVDAAGDHSPAHYAALVESFRWHFPRLTGLAFPFAWGGPICSTTRLTPFFGSTDGGRVFYGLGYTGHGIGTTRVAGKVLADLVLERESEWTALAMVRRKPFPYPPEPLRRLAVSAVTRALRRVDGGGRPGMLLRILDALGIGFSS